MKKLFYFAAMLLCFVSCAYSGDTYRDIDIYLDSGVKGNKYEYTYGEDFHRVFTTSEPVHLINILYTDYKEGIEEEKKGNFEGALRTSTFCSRLGGSSCSSKGFPDD